MLLQIATSYLVQIPDPGAPLAPPGSEGILTMMRWGLWIAFACVFSGFIYIAAKMGISHNQGYGGGEEAAKLWKPAAAALILTNILGIIAALVTFA